MCQNVPPISGHRLKGMTLSRFEPGAVILLNLSPTRGDEKKATRPCIVVEGGATPLELIIVLPITDASKKHSPIFIPITDLKRAGLTKPSVIDTYQIRTVSTQRIIRSLGEIGADVLFRVRKNLARILEIEEAHIQ